MRLRIFAMLAVALLILASGAGVWSQTVQGVITGTVTDPTGAVVPNAAVMITNVATNISQNTTTGNDGSYRFSLVPPGTYTVEIKAANFATVRASGLVVEASQTVPYNVKLELAKAQQVIEVTEQVPLVQTATSDLGFQVDSSTIQHAALVDRDIFDVLPFMAPSVSMGLDMTPTSGGAREAGTSYMLNGAEDNNNFSAGALNINPPLETVEDFALITNVMSAQYGRGAGAVVSANQKSGSNKFHGVAYEQNRNATLNANDFFYNRDLGASIQAHQQDPLNPALPARPKYIKNQFGGTVGGPIRKDKTFFFFGYDRFKLLQGVTQANNFVPTPTALQFIQANAGPLAQQVLSAYPPATSTSPCAGQPGTGGTNLIGCLSVSDPQITTTDSYYGRVDQNFSNSDRLSFAVNVARQTFVDNTGGGSSCGTTSFLTGGVGIPSTTLQNQHNLALTETHTFGPRVANEVTLSQNRFFNPSTEGDPAKQTAPRIAIDNQNENGLAYSFGPGEGGQVVGFTQDRWAIQDNLTWTVGRHALKFGGGANYGILYRNWDLGLPGEYEFGEPFALNTGVVDPKTGIITYPSANPVTGAPGCAPNALILPSCDPGSNSTATQNFPVLQSNGTIANVINEPNSNFVADYPYFMETSINPATGAKANAYRHYTSHDYGVFAQDDWKITSRLTLNLGLRWERFGAPSEVNGNIAQFTNFSGCNWATNAACIAAARTVPVSRMWNTQNHDFGPRIGFAYDPFGKGTTAIRGGYGIFYDRIFDNIWSNGAWNPPFYALADLQADIGNTIFYSNPASVGAGYVPNSLPGALGPVSLRTMDVNMHDSSGQNFYFGLEHQFFGGLLLSAKYQGSLGRHLPMLENVNRVDGIGYNFNAAQGLLLTPIKPNPLYNGFNYRSNSVSSNYNSLILEATKRMGHGLQFDMSYTRSKELDVNSELFAGCSTIGGQSAPYYYISNAQPGRNYGPGAENHPNAFKFNTTYELPFLKSEKGFVGHALGGWSIGSFFQFYSGHPVDLYDGMSRKAARDASGALVLDPNGIPYNIGGDYNLDGVLNDHPVFLGSNINSVYSGANPADGIFTSNARIGCGFPGMPATIVNTSGGVCPGATAKINSLFGNPGYPTSGSLFERFGTLGRDVFHGPQFVDLDLGLHKTFKITESMNLRFSAEAQNLANHPNFDAIRSNLNSGTFGQAQIVDGGAGLPTQKSRVMSLSLRLAF